ncbi:MAG: hypothetical protein ABSD02_17885 [Steroidobacteraceae bacterium]|jgi:hypothetical protein
MIEDAHWQRELMAALHLEDAFNAVQLESPTAEEAAFLKPTQAESERAVANMRAWRAYLPERCVASMVDDGWQWST